MLISAITVSARMAADAQMMSHFYTPLHHMYGSLHSSRYSSSSGAEKYPVDGGYLGDTTRYMPTPGVDNNGGGNGDRSPSTPVGHQSYDDRQYLTPPASLDIPEVKPLPHQLLKEDKDHVKDEIGGQHNGGSGSDKLSQYPAAPDASSDYSGQYFVQPAAGGGNDPLTAAHTDLSHPGHPAYGGYSTTGSFGMHGVGGNGGIGGNSGGSSHRSSGSGANKSKTQTGKFVHILLNHGKETK